MDSTDILYEVINQKKEFFKKKAIEINKAMKSTLEMILINEVFTEDEKKEIKDLILKDII